MCCFGFVFLKDATLRQMTTRRKDFMMWAEQDRQVGKLKSHLLCYHFVLHLDLCTKDSCQTPDPVAMAVAISEKKTYILGGKGRAIYVVQVQDK